MTTCRNPPQCSSRAGGHNVGQACSVRQGAQRSSAGCRHDAQAARRRPYGVHASQRQPTSPAATCRQQVQQPTLGHASCCWVAKFSTHSRTGPACHICSMLCSPADVAAADRPAICGVRVAVAAGSSDLSRRRGWPSSATSASTACTCPSRTRATTSRSTMPRCEII